MDPADSTTPAHGLPELMVTTARLFEPEDLVSGPDPIGYLDSDVIARYGRFTFWLFTSMDSITSVKSVVWPKNFMDSPTLSSPSVILTAATLGFAKNFTTSPTLISAMVPPFVGYPFREINPFFPVLVT
jgi:hypothetical protein